MVPYDKILVFFVILSVTAITLMVYYLRDLRLCDLESSLKIENATFENGNLVADELIFEPGEYSRDSDGTVRICPERYCWKRDKICVRKCCARGKIIKDFMCSADDGNRFADVKIPLLDVANGSEASIALFFGPPCLGGYNKSFGITKEGFLKELDEESVYHSIFEYCIDFYDDVGELDSLICPESSGPLFESEATSRGFEYYKYFVAASVVFFLLTLLTYALLPDLRDTRRSLHGWCLMSHIACSIVAYTALAFIQFGKGYSPTNCIILGYTLYYSFMAGFLWMSIMCFDMWWAICFSSKKPHSLFDPGRYTNEQKYIFYFVCAFGIALLFLASAYLMETNSLPDNRFRPDFGNVDKTCFINKRDAKWVFLYGPLSAILFINTFLFLDTVIKIMAIFKETKGVRSNEAKSKRGRSENAVLYLKLFMTMGVSWLMEIISFIFTKDVSDNWWVLTDIINGSRGLLIFLIFVLKGKVIRQLNNRLSYKNTRRTPSFITSVYTKASSYRRNSSWLTTKAEEKPEPSRVECKFKKITASEKPLINKPVVDGCNEFEKDVKESLRTFHSPTSSGIKISCDELRSVEEVEEYEDREEEDEERVEDVTEERPIHTEKENIDTLTEYDENYSDNIRKCEDPVRKETKREIQMDPKNENMGNLTEENEMKSVEKPSQDMRKRDNYRE